MSKLIITLLASFLISVGCDQKSRPPLKIGTNNWIGYESLFLAQHLGLYNGHSIKLIEMPSATDVARSLRNESLDVAALTLDETLSLLQYVPDLRIILVMDVSKGADALLAKSDIHSLRDLKNKRVGVENTAVGAIVLDSALQAGQLNPSDIQVVSVTANAHESYYAENKIDALVTFEPHKTRLLAKGANTLFDSSQIPGIIIDVLVTRPSVIQHHSEALQALIFAHFQALSHIHSHDPEAMTLMSSHLGVDPQAILALFKGIEAPDLNKNRILLRGDDPELSTTIRDLATLMQQRRLLFKPVVTHHLVDGRLITSESSSLPPLDS